MWVNVIQFLSTNYLKPLFGGTCPKKNAAFTHLHTYMLFLSERERDEVSVAHWEVLIILPMSPALNIIIHVSRW